MIAFGATLASVRLYSAVEGFFRDPAVFVSPLWEFTVYTVGLVAEVSGVAMLAMRVRLAVDALVVSSLSSFILSGAGFLHATDKYLELMPQTDLRYLLPGIVAIFLAMATAACIDLILPIYAYVIKQRGLLR